MLNPFTGTDLSEADAKNVEKLREVRKNARKDARSGNPAKRASGKRAITLAGHMLHNLYLRAM